MKRLLIYSGFALMLAGCGQEFRATQIGVDGFVTENVGYKVDKFDGTIMLKNYCSSALPQNNSFSTDHYYLYFTSTVKKDKTLHMIQAVCNLDTWIFIDPNSKLIFKNGDEVLELTTLSGSENSRNVHSVSSVVYVSETAYYVITRDQLEQIRRMGVGTLIRIESGRKNIDSYLTASLLKCLTEYLNGYDLIKANGIPVVAK